MTPFYSGLFLGGFLGCMLGIIIMSCIIVGREMWKDYRVGRLRSTRG